MLNTGNGIAKARKFKKRSENYNHRIERKKRRNGYREIEREREVAPMSERR